MEIASSKNLQRQVRIQVNKTSTISGCLRDVEEQIYVHSKQSPPPQINSKTSVHNMRAAETKMLISIKSLSLKDQLRSTAMRDGLKIKM